jgi:hypothetical protein
LALIFFGKGFFHGFPDNLPYAGDTGIAILYPDESMLVSNFKNILMNGTYLPDE